jgi:response regulator RpfG family c-di-GMP phosphodiesterase
MYPIEIKNSELVEVFLNKQDLALLTQYVIEKYRLPEKITTEISIQLSRKFLSKFKTKWNDAHRMKTRFLEKHNIWCLLSTTINIENELSDEANNNKNSVGRPSLDFASCSDRTKQKRSSALCANEGLQAIEHAHLQALRTTRRKPAADIVSVVTAASPKRIKRISESLTTESGDGVPLTSDEALALILDMGLSKHQYEMLCRCAKKHNFKMLPPYDQLKVAKDQSCPPQECLTVSATRASVPLQHLMDHTAERIIRSLTEDEVIYLAIREQFHNHLVVFFLR